MSLTQIKQTRIWFVILLLFFPLFAAAPLEANDASKTSFFADMRFRQESDVEQATLPDRHRQQVRIRFGGIHQLSDEFTLGIRIVSGGLENPNSPYQTIGNAFNRFELSFDRFYATYSPNFLPGASFTGGKFAHPFQTNPVYSQLVWDVDVQPEGGFVAYQASDLGALKKLDLVIGDYLVKENDQNDMTVFVAQLAAQIQMGSKLRANFALGYYNYDSFTQGGATVFCDNNGNATNGNGTTTCGSKTVAGTAFVSDFEQINPYIALHSEGSAYPMVISAEYVKNMGANISQDTALMAGASIGSTQKPGNLQLYYVYMVVQQDAVLTLVASDDFLFQTNHKTHRFGMKYQFREDVMIHPYLATSQVQNGGSDDNQWRARLEIDIAIK